MKLFHINEEINESFCVIDKKIYASTMKLIWKDFHCVQLSENKRRCRDCIWDNFNEIINNSYIYNEITLILYRCVHGYNRVWVVHAKMAKKIKWSWDLG